MPCPYLRNGECVIAYLLGICRNKTYGRHGFCVVVPERCSQEYVAATGETVREWETCRYYRCIADCRYCQHYDSKTRRCMRLGKKIPPGRELGLCCAYEGPKPPPSIQKYLERRQTC